MDAFAWFKMAYSIAMSWIFYFNTCIVGCDGSAHSPSIKTDLWKCDFFYTWEREHESRDLLSFWERWARLMELCKGLFIKLISPLASSMKGKVSRWHKMLSAGRLGKLITCTCGVNLPAFYAWGISPLSFSLALINLEHPFYRMNIWAN